MTTTNESLEEKCEELRKQIDDLHREVEIERRKNERLQIEQRTRKDEAVTTPTSICSREPVVSEIIVIYLRFIVYKKMAFTL